MTLQPAVVVCWIALACVTVVHSAGISLGGLSLSFGAGGGGEKGWHPPPSHGWAPAPAKGWHVEKPAPSVSISLPKPDIAQLLAIPLRVLKWKLNALGSQQISFRFSLPKISVNKVEPAPWKPHQHWAPAPKPWAPPVAAWSPGPPPPWNPPSSHGWKETQPPQVIYKGQPEAWKPAESHGWKEESPVKGWQPPAGWKPPQGWVPDSSNVKYKE